MDVMSDFSGSNSSAQRNAEGEALDLLADKLQLPGRFEINKRIRLKQSSVVVDGFLEQSGELFVVETNARVGSAMKTSTRNKVVKDTFKLILIDRSRTALDPGLTVHKILCFLDERAPSSFGPKSWVQEAWIEFGIKCEVVQVSEETRRTIAEAQSHRDFSKLVSG